MHILTLHAAIPHLCVDGDLADEVHVVPVDQAAVRVAQHGRVERRHVLHVRLAGQLRQVVVVALAQDLALPVPCRTVVTRVVKPDSRARWAATSAPQSPGHNDPGRSSVPVLASGATRACFQSTNDGSCSRQLYGQRLQDAP